MSNIVKKEVKITKDELQEMHPFLSSKEVSILHDWQQTEEHPLSPSLQAKLFELFLNGNSIEAIHKLNPQYSMGQIMHARVKGGWDEKLKEYTEGLLKNTMNRLGQVSLESVNFICDMIAATNKVEGDKIRKYLQTGDPAELGNLTISSLAGYNKAVEILQKLTGQDKKTNVSGTVTLNHQGSVKTEAMSTDEASSLLRELLGKK